LIGAPGTGKSEYAASAAKYGLKVLLLAFRPKEIDSAGYMKYGINLNAELFHDEGWMPSVEEFEAGAFVRLLKRLRELQKDDTYDVIILDPITDVGDLIMHQILAIEEVGSPSELEGGGAIRAYGDLKRRWGEFLKAATYLCHAPHPKHVIACVHAKPVQEEGIKLKGQAPKATSDKKSQGVQYFGDVLADLEGSVKYGLGGEFQLQLFTQFTSEKVNVGTTAKPKYETQDGWSVLVKPDKDRFAKVALGYLSDQTLPNDFGDVLTAIAKSYE
jgi:hypothetical protein